MDNTYAPTENKEQKKIKVESIDTIVTMHGDKPYYEINAITLGIVLIIWTLLLKIERNILR